MFTAHLLYNIPQIYAIVRNRQMGPLLAPATRMARIPEKMNTLGPQHAVAPTASTRFYPG